jgi:hypothetical protein
MTPLGSQNMNGKENCDSGESSGMTREQRCWIMESGGTDTSQGLCRCLVRLAGLIHHKGCADVWSGWRD